MTITNRITKLVTASREFGIDLTMKELVSYLSSGLAATDCTAYVFALAYGLVVPNTDRSAYVTTRLGRAIVETCSAPNAYGDMEAV